MKRHSYRGVPNAKPTNYDPIRCSVSVWRWQCQCWNHVLCSKHVITELSNVTPIDSNRDQITLILFTGNTITHLMFVPCIISRSRNNQHNAQICTTALFMLVPTCFGRLLPKHVGASMNKAVVQICALCWLFLLTWNISKRGKGVICRDTILIPVKNVRIGILLRSTSHETLSNVCRTNSYTLKFQHQEKSY
jgi:hypothetical protein